MMGRVPVDGGRPPFQVAVDDKAKSAQPGATRAMQEIYNAEDGAHAERAVEAFARSYGTKWPNAVAKNSEDRDELPAFYDFPAEHWVHLRTTNPIESTFSAVKPRTKVKFPRDRTGTPST
nr:hypothetical protein KitaXyl93_05620 [Kitasatospora sp. Xyl93]